MKEATSDGLLRQQGSQAALGVAGYQADLTPFSSQAKTFNDGCHFARAGTSLLAGGQWSNVWHYARTSGILTTGASLTVATDGVLTIVGDYPQLLPGTLNFYLAGTAPGTNHSRLAITGDAPLTGTVGIRLADSYLPNPGDTLNVMTYKRRAADFVCYNGLLVLGQNRRLLTQYSATNLTLVTVLMADPTDPPVRVTAQYATAMACWPAGFVGYGLASSTNLNAPKWTVLLGVTNRYVETPMVPQKFFRLQIAD